MALTHLRAGSALLLLALATASVSQAGTPPVQTDAQLGFFHDARVDVLAHFKRVGLLPAYLPPGFSQRDDIKATLESKASEALRQAGFEVVGSEDYKAAYERFSRQLGGLYDPLTGALKPQQARAAEQNARREFIDKDHLDGYVVLTIRSVKANFNFDFAYWDGAQERSDGRPTAPSFFERLNHPNNFTGTLPAYSLLLQISNNADQIVYGRFGGIQLASYHDAAHGKVINDFVPVPPDNLFRDEKRLERAVHFASVPLLHTAEEIAAGQKDPSINTFLIGDLPPPPAGVRPQPESPLKVSREQILAKTHRVVVSTLGHAGFTLGSEVGQRYMALIRAELQPLGWEVIESDRALSELGAALRTSSGMYDPMTGVLNTARVSELRKGVFTHLGISPAPDAILWVQVIPTFTEHHWGSVTWDGVSQSAITLGSIEHVNSFVGEAGIRAMSLLVQLRDADDMLLYEGRGGVQLLQQLKGKELVNLAPTELFQDKTRDQPAVHVALRDLVLTPEELDRELHPHATASR
jgi:hypothetical protein